MENNSTIKFPARLPDKSISFILKSKQTFWYVFSLWFHATVMIIGYFMAKILFQARFLGRKNLKKVKKSVIITNHSLYLDPPYIGVSTFPKQVYFTGMLKHFSVPVLASVIRNLKTIPLYRGEQREISYAYIRNIFKKNRHIAFWAERELNHMSNKLSEFKKGAFIIAIENSVPIVPIVIHKKRRHIWGKTIPFFFKLKVQVLSPIYLDDFKPASSDKLEWADILKIHCQKVMQEALDSMSNK